MTDDAHTCVGFSPKTVTTIASSGIPLEELSERNAILASDRLASFVGLDEMEGIAVIDKSGLGGLRSLDAVGSLGGSRGGSCWGVSDDGHTCIGLSPETTAILSRSRIPGQELGQRDAVLVGDVLASLVRLHEVECIAVIYKRRLSWLRCLDTLGESQLLMSVTSLCD